MAKQTFEYKGEYPDEAPTDRQLYRIVQLLRELQLKRRPSMPITRLEASQLIDSLKRQKVTA